MEKVVLAFLLVLSGSIIYGQDISYESIVNKPALAVYNSSDTLSGGIHYDVSVSSMVNKNIDYCTWHAGLNRLIVNFTGELNASDLSILNAIVENN